MSKKMIFAIVIAALAAFGSAPAAPPQAGSRVRLGATAAAPTISWSAPTVLSRTAFHSTQPTLSLDAKGQVYTAWTEWTGSGWGRNMMFATNASGAWTPATVVAPLAYDAIDDVGFPTVAASPSGTAWVAYHDGDYAAGHMIIVGAQYSNGVMGSTFNLDGSPGATSYVCIGVSPVDESLHAIWMDDTVMMFGLGTRYRDGKTGAWAPPDLMPVLSNVSKYTYQVNHIAFDPKGAAHAVFQTRYNKAQVWYTNNPTPKNLATWGSVFNVAPDTLLSDVLPRVACDKDGDAYVVWHEIVDGVEQARLRRTVNGAWQATENISHSAGNSENPSIAVDPDSKEIYIVWQEQVSSTNWDVFMNSYVQAPGTTDYAWTGPVNLTNSSGQTLNPNIAVMPGGNLYLVYQEEIPGSGGRAEILFTSKVTPPKPKLQALLPPTITTQVNRILFAAKKVNTVSFTPNDANDPATLQEYRIYRRKAGEGDDAFVFLATLDLATFGYKDANLAPKQKYAYQVSVVNKDGLELKSGVTIEP
jgi:hypothetical protein